MLLKHLLRNSFIKSGIKQISQKRVYEVTSDIVPYIRKEYSILEIGCGICLILKWLNDRGYNARGIDIKDISIYPDVKADVYEGKKLPYKTNQFDCVLLLSVLHHTNEPDAILQEASRVSKRIIIAEDVYDGMLQKYITYIMDSIINLEFFGHPHSNRTNKEWRAIFKVLKLRLVASNISSYWRLFSKGVYIVEKGT